MNSLPADLIATLRYKPGWTFRIGGPLNGYLCVFATTPDSNQPTRERCTQHMFALPAVVTHRWLFDCLLLCELHEAGEFFRIEADRPFFPHHQDEGSPYELVDRWAIQHEGGGDAAQPPESRTAHDS